LDFRPIPRIDAAPRSVELHHMLDHSELPSTPAYLTEREGLDPDLRKDFDALVLAYRHYASIHHKQPFVSYKVLAELVKIGWRGPPKK
jgi:hypothetical protein